MPVLSKCLSYIDADLKTSGDKYTAGLLYKDLPYLLYTVTHFLDMIYFPKDVMSVSYGNTCITLKLLTVLPMFTLNSNISESVWILFEFQTIQHTIDQIEQNGKT